jgi:hypothetical protein
MRIASGVLLLSLTMVPAMFSAEGVSEIFDGQVKSVENDVLRLAEAMPADKYNFAPTDGAFKGVRTFAEQVKHIATITYMLSSAALGQKPPIDLGTGENGPASVSSKAQIVEYLRGSLVFAHKAAVHLTEKNQLDDIRSPFENAPMKRLTAVSMIAYHSFDHYGQMVVYARMNGVIPPASQPAPAAAKK